MAKKKNTVKKLWESVKKALGGSSTSGNKTTRQVSTYSPKEMSEYNKRRQASSSGSKNTTNTKKNNKKTNEAPIRTRTSSEYSSVNNNAMASRKLIREIETKTKSDIAPINKKKKEDDEKWFKKGAFEDGYEFGDVTKTVASTVGDAGLNIVKGVGSLGEGLLDLGRYGVAELGELLGAENFANRQRVKAQENSIDNFFKDVETGVDQWSILGGKSDAVMQGLGQVGGIILTGGIGAGAGLTTAGATALTTGMMGASSMGSGMSEAYQNKATDEEAWKYGAIKGVVDAGSELIFGGLGKTVKAVGLSKGLTSLDDAFAQKLSSKISNQFMKNLTEYGVKSSAEGLEEVLAGLGSAVGKKLTYASEEELNELIKDENLLDQFVVGAVTSGIAQSGLVPGMSQGSLKEANKSGRDFITGYTQNEQTVVDKVVENRVKEQEADGKKLTNKEKTKISEEVQEELKKGYIDIDTIESTLGGETYKNYKSAVDNEAKLQEEYDTLHKMERGKMTGEQIDRETELKSQLDELKNNSKTSQMREQLDFEISKLTEKDTLLRESYNERSRRGQSFEADLTKYDAKQQEVIKKATESGILNNTNRTHEFVDMVAKISADKGVSFDFTSNEKLKESGFAIDGKTINGYIKDGNIAVNINSNKALNTVVGHEITHVLEGTELYTELQNAVKEYATTKGDYDTRYKALQGLYKDVDSAVIENEITADLVGDYLFTDADFVNRLSAEKPNVFKKIYDEIKYLVKTVTGTKESRELAKVQKLFEDAYKNSNSTKSDISTKTTAEAKTLNEVDMEYDAKTETVAYSLSSLEEAFKYNESEVEYKNAREDYVQALMKSIGDTSEDGRKKAENYLNSMFLVHDMIARDRDRLDYESAEGKSAWVGNSEYGGSIDFSTLCAKRRLFTGTFDAIQNALPDTVLTDKDYLEIRNLLLEHNQEAPCSMCYVEGSRAKHGTYVKKFLNDYLKTNPAWKPQIADFTSTTRLEQTRIQHPEAYAEYVKAMNKLSQRKPKEASVRTDYKGEILKSFKDGESVEQKNLNGGVRFNSFSDFEIIHTLDAMQVITDMARVGLNGQAYTKVKEFAECFGNTGMKINLSLVAKDVDADGNLVYDEVNGMKHSEAIDLRNRYSDNVGTVIVVFNEAQMKSALANPEIDFVLPFHRSQWRKSQYTMMGLPTQTKDFTNVQNDRFRNPKTGRPKKVADGNIMPNEYWDFTKSGRENAQIYLDYINENNYIPKFDSVLEKVDGKYVLPEGAVGDGYFKLLIDFKMYNNDGVGIPQSPVMPEFNMPYIQQMLEDYKGGHHSFPVAHDVVEDFLKTKKGSKDIAPVKDNGVQYSLSDSDGNTLTKEQREYFKDSKVRDENGNLKVMYHGSPEAFTVFDKRKAKSSGLYGRGFYFTESESHAQQYGSQYEVYLNITNPIQNGTNNITKDQLRNFVEALAENEDYGIENYGYGATVDSITDDVYGKDDFAMLMDLNVTCVGNMVEAIELFNEVNGTDYNGIVAPTETVAFYPNQIKKVDNKQPTSDADIRYSLSDDYAPLTEAQANERDAQQRDGIFALNENDMPPEVDAPYYEELDTAPVNPFDERDMDDVGKRNVKAYMYENPEVKPFFQEEAQIMLRELQDSTKGEKQFNSQLYYETGGEQGWFGTKRQTSEEVAYLLDRFNYTYADIEKGLKAIIEDHGAENNAISKRIEFMIDERLREGYTDFTSGYDIPNNPDYLDLLKNKNITEYTDEAYNNWLQSLADEEPNDGITFDSTVEQQKVEDIAPVKTSEEKQATPKRATKKQAKPKVKGTTEHQEIARILDVEPKTESQRNSRKWAIFKANVFDKGAVFEDLSLKKKNRELMGKWNHTLYSESRAQRLIGNGDAENGVKALNSIIEEVGKEGLTSSLQEYLYHKHNVDRMTLANRFEDAENKAVFGDNVTAEMSQEIVDQYEFAEPKLMEYAEQIYNYNKHLRKMLVDGGVISQETANLWEKMYPHYVPIRRVNDTGLNVNVPLDTGRTGVNAPIKRATGGSADILPLFDTMAMRTMQTYKAVAKNNFGVELKNTLSGETVSMPTTVDELIDSLDAQEDLLQEGKNGSKPTFTVFENGERVTFEITEDMYDALKPVSDSSLLSKTIKPLNIASNIHRGLLTEYNPVFLLTNGIKDIQDVLINSQHATKTYLKIPEAHLQILKKGYWYNEYMANGGEQNTYFDNETNTFETKKDSTAKKVITFPLKAISRVNNYVEMIPRLAEYIASRESGRSVEVSMLDSARVTTNFRAGGDLTKFINRNGGTFLNASVQGAMQQVRNVREANANGLKGWANLVTKFAIAGAPAFILNNLIWDDDDEYEELSDYVKQNYYIVGKYGDGQFIRIPKGRTVSVIQEGIRQIGNKVTGNDEADLKSFLEFVVTNLAPNNPLENNVLAPIMQVKNNETWYGEDLVPTRLQDLPVSEQFDESTDSLSRAIGEKFDISPIKVNYLLDQYTGGVGDVLLPMLTPEAESGDDTLVGNLLAPLKKKFTTDSVMNNQNVSDFYAMSDELKLNANKVDATEEDILHNKYMSAIRGDMGELYAKKRELQNSGLSNKAKYEQVREIQRQIDELAKDAMYQINTFGGADVYGRYATVGEKQFLKSEEGEWRTISDERVEKQKEASKLLGITAQEYWKNDDDKYAYDWAVKYPEYYQVSRAISDDLLTYWKHNDHMWNNIRADKDENGKSISGSKKKKIIEYINGIDDLSYEEKLVLFKKYYPADDTYNYEIIDYLNSREDITYEQMETILKELDFNIDSQGNITW